MAYQLQVWEFSDAEGEVWGTPKEGWRPLKITSASYDPETHIYKMTLKDLEDNIIFQQKYTLDTRTETGGWIEDGRGRGTMVSVMKALFGLDKGVPHPSNARGGVIMGEVKLNKTISKKDGETEMVWTNIYHYKTAPEVYVLAYSDIDQEFVPEETQEGA